MNLRGKNWLWPLAIFLLTVAVRVAYLLASGEFQTSAGSGAEMERAAFALATDGYLGNAYPGVKGPSAHVAPLYPSILALIYLTFGPGTLGATIAQTGLAIFTTALAFSLLPVVGGVVRLGRGAGIVGGFLLAVAPINLWIETSGSWEATLANLTVLGFLVGFASVSSAKWRVGSWVFALGALIGLAALMSPGLVPAAALIMAGEFLVRKGMRRRVFQASAVMCLVAAAITAPWIVRNQRVFGQFIPVRSNLGLELAMGNHDEANGKTFAIDWDDPDDPSRRIHPFNSASERDRYLELGEPLYMKGKLDTAVTWIKQNPGHFLSLTLNRFRLFWFPPPGMWSSSSRARWIKAVLLSGISLLAFAGLVLLWVEGHPFRIHLTAVLFGPSLVHLVTHVQPRYAYPVLGVSALLASYVLVYWVGKPRTNGGEANE